MRALLSLPVRSLALSLVDALELTNGRPRADCDGASFGGNKDGVSPNGLYYRGHRILEQWLIFLRENTPFSHAQVVLLAGESAGGLATILHADRVRSWLPQPLVTKFVAVPFSGFFLVSVVCSLKWELDDLTRLPGPQNCRWCAKVW